MKFIFSYMKKDAWFITFTMAVKLAASCAELLLPYVLQHLIDDIVPTKNIVSVILWGCLMIVLALLCRALNIKANKGAVKVARDNIYRIRKDLFWKTLQLSGNQIDEVGLPSLISRMTSDSYNVQNFMQSIQMMGVRAPIMLLGGIFITMTMDMGLASILCIMAPILIVIVVFISFKGIPLYEKVQRNMDTLVRIMRENITGIRVVKALSKEDYEKERFATANKKMATDELKASMVMAMPGPVMTLFLNTGLTLVVIIGAKRVNAGIIEPGVILAFLTYFNMILMGVMGLNRIFMMISRANASAKRMAEVVNAAEELTPLPEIEAAQFDATKYEEDDYIVFDHVDFSYKQDALDVATDREKCLYDIHFTIKKGGSLGIIGATGSGKTTIINLLMRFYDASTGNIFLDGKDVRTYERDALHKKFGVVFQNDVIFADTLFENIVFGRDVDLDDVKSAAHDAKASEFIEAYEEQYEHEATIHGANLSGGQKQRTLIARALVAKPDILILDDASSALDYKTDADLRKAIREHYEDATTIIIAQRISSIMSMDHIIVMDEGRMIGYGTHEELLETCQVYNDIYKTQMGEL